MDVFRELFLMQQVWATLFSAANKIQATGDQYFKKLTSRQIMTMIAILHLPKDQTTLNNIARKLGTTKQSVKQLVTIMERKGFVETVPSMLDGRAVNVHITDLGMNALSACGEKSFSFFADLFEQLTAEELETLWDLLKKLYRFDGEEQDGFEEEVDMGMGDGLSGSLLTAFEEFKRRRNHGRSSEERNKVHE